MISVLSDPVLCCSEELHLAFDALVSTKKKSLYLEENLGFCAGEAPFSDSDTPGHLLS